VHNSKENDLGAEVQGIFIPGSVLPQRIFENAFGRYLFFDADIGSSDTLISTLYEVAKACLGTTLKVDVFASSNRILLGRLDVNSNWVTQINEISKTLRTAGDCDGLILVDVSQKWVVYQTRPVDIGILAFDGMAGLSGLESAIADCFFGCDDITNWLVGRSQRDIELVNDLGRDYLAALVKNYGDARC
jgi:hypothetical protein